MPSARNAELYFESGQPLVPYAVMTDSGDHKTFTAGTLWSGKSGFEPIIRPNGVVTGNRMVTPAASGSDDVVDVAAFSAWSKGIERAVSSATDLSITRPATDVAKVVSVTMDETGAVAAVAGSDGSDTTFSSVRGADGGPPLIAVDSVEIAQVRLLSATSAPIEASAIFQVPGQHTERADFPTIEIEDPIGRGLISDDPASKKAHIRFDSILPLSHTGPTCKRVYIQYHEPIFAKVARVEGYVPVEMGYSVQSSEHYGGASASVSRSIGQGSFTAFLKTGVSDVLIQEQGEVLTFKFFPDKNKSDYQLTQGVLGISRTFPVS
ncbi:MAG: hypothetical protein HQL53_14375, partial [Magnetococcales bacterium]|nr:hypothetical protein [Magnetococcales bacterium]